jgi:hypothetical protein
VGGEVVEHYSRMELSLPGDVHLPRAELVSRFRDRYPQIPESFWRQTEGLPVFSRRDLPFGVSEEEGEDQRFFTTSFSEPGHPAR